MLHSTLTCKGQTTIPGKIREALRIKPGDRLEYGVEEDHAAIRVHPGAPSLKGVLASNKGKSVSFAQIRQAAATAARQQDHEKHAAIAGKLFEACDRGGIVVVLLPAVLTECVFNLESFYEKDRNHTADVPRRLITGPGIEVNEEPIHLDALERYGRTKMHFVDCLNAATGAALKLPVSTFDPDFRRFADVVVQNG